MENLCRICARSDPDQGSMLGVFATTLECDQEELQQGDGILVQTVAQAMGSCLDVEIKPNDKLPQQVCVECLVKLKESWTLKVTCKASEKQLRQMLVDGGAVKEEIGKQETEETVEDDFLLDSVDDGPLDDAVGEELEAEGDTEKFVPRRMVNPEDPLHSEFGWLFSELETGKYRTKRGDDDTWETVEFWDQRCCGCFQFFTTKAALQEHCREEHKEERMGVDKKRFECSACLKLFASTDALNFHQKLARSKQLFHCKLCDVLSPSKRQLRAHLKLHLESKLDHVSAPEPETQTNETNDQSVAAPELPPTRACREFRNFVTFDYIAFNGFYCCECWLFFGTKREMKRHAEKKHFGNRGFEEDNVCFACWRSFEDKDVFDQHMAELNSGHVYFCKVCNLMFRSSDKLQIHQQTAAKHEGFIELEMIDVKEEVELSEVDSPYKIQTLKDPADDANAYSNDVDYDPNEGTSQHVKSFEEPYGRRLYASPKTKNDADLAETSVVEISSQDAVRCCGCYRTFLTEEELADHSQEHRQELEEQNDKDQPYECDRCSRRFNKAVSLQMHQEFVRTVQTYTCKLCSEKFSFQTPFIVHYNQHEQRMALEDRRGGPRPKVSDEPPRFYCCFMSCTQSFEEYGELLRHVDSLHGVKRNQFKDYRDSDDNCCELCFRSFNNYRALLRHILHQKRTSLSRHTCSTCGVQMRTLSALKDHENKHLGIKPYECELCNKTFGSKTILKNHMIVHNTDRPFSCEICGKTFARKRNWKDHSMIHQDVKPWECEICKLTFRIETQFMTHKRRHTGVRPYKCSFCDKVFSHATDRKRHQMAAHTGEKPHSCTFCPLAFVRKRQLVIHERTHTGEKPFECPYCSQAFIQQSYLNRHMATHKQQLSTQLQQGTV